MKTIVCVCVECMSVGEGGKLNVVSVRFISFDERIDHLLIAFIIFFLFRKTDETTCSHKQQKIYTMHHRNNSYMYNVGI